MSQVIVIGGGPTGLWAASELRLAGIDVLLLERDTERGPHSKALTLHPRTLEVLAMRGVEAPFLAEGTPIPSGHFAGLDTRLDFRSLDSPFPFTLFLPQTRTEELLEAHALALGVRIERGVEVTGIAQDEDGVLVGIGGSTLRAEYVIGCDGARSLVRQQIGVAFPGTDATVYGMLGDVVLDEPPAPPGKTRFGIDGGLMVVQLPNGTHRFVGTVPGFSGRLTLERLRALSNTVFGTDFGMRDPVWLSTFSNATRQAESYRVGRVFLAGDAAHVHFPAGGVGLNVGLQDAMNLGWKLAAVLNGEAEESLLDTYHAERHPVGEQLLRHTAAQTALMTAFTPEGQALRGLLSELIATQPGLSLELARKLSAVDVSYGEIVGSRSPVFARLPRGKAVELDLTDADLPTGWEGVTAAVIRPDGHVASVTRSPV
ncbi:FAD-dependent monooxygenase [Allokutzneria oryzae]|uniref:FAD-dependent monooxygenase n=1 Tax=Allokutzneria oryzae TaxID=1378989 RepID=A0ABV6A6H0_9PSEU